MKRISLILIILGLSLSGCGLNLRVGDNVKRDSPMPPLNQNKDSEPVPAIVPIIEKDLSSLDLSNQNLSQLPSDVLSRSDLIELDISNNNLSGALPAEIKNLNKLKVLKANNNIMTGVPAEIGQMLNLEILDLSNNQLTGLPYELGNLKNLKTFNISGNAYAESDLKIITDKLPSSVNVIK